MGEVQFQLVDDASFDAIPLPAAAGARCQTCDYWERLDGGRDAPDVNAADATARASLKRRRLLAGRAAGGSYAMVAVPGDGDAPPVAYAQFGPLSAYPRALSIRERYPQLPESPAPWVVTCLQVAAGDSDEDRNETGAALLDAVCNELDRRGITAVEAYPERVSDEWLPSPGPIAIYEAAGFERVAGDERYPVYRRELSGETAVEIWSDLLQASRPHETDDWPLPLPSTPDADDFFRLPPERPKRPNPFGDD
jgi:hypothetical protein